MPDWKLELIDKELEELFDNQLVMVNHSSLVEIESRKNLAKLKIQRELQITLEGQIQSLKLGAKYMQ